MASEVRAEVADVFITGEVLQSNTIDYPQGFVIKPSANQTVYLEFQVFNLKCTELILIMKALMIEGEKNKSGKPFRFKGVPNMTT